MLKGAVCVDALVSVKVVANAPTGAAPPTPVVASETDSDSAMETPDARTIDDPVESVTVSSSTLAGFGAMGAAFLPRG
jgi:hypothetical protein